MDGKPPSLSTYDNGTNFAKAYRHGMRGPVPYLDWILTSGNGTNFITLGQTNTAAAMIPAGGSGQTYEIGFWVSVPDDCPNAFASLAVALEEYNSGLSYLFDANSADLLTWAQVPKGGLARPRYMSAQMTTASGSTAYILTSLVVNNVGTTARTGVRIYEPTVRRVS